MTSPATHPIPESEADVADPGSTRPCAAFASCAAEPCDQDAVIEGLHAPPGGDQVWVPLCQAHLDVVGHEAIEYLVESHGFIPAVTA